MRLENRGLENAKRLYYRGVIKSCNYQCSYCPFAKKKSTQEEILQDEKEGEYFCKWVEETPFVHHLNILFTPYGEALIYEHTAKALAKLSQLEKVQAVGIQTNLSIESQKLIEWLKKEKADFKKIKLWATYHPQMTTRKDFVSKVIDLYQYMDLSVGMVGNPDALEEAEAMRKELPPYCYLWINKMEGLSRRYTEEEIERWLAIDPLFELELYSPRFEKNGSIKMCSAGKESFLIEAEGAIRACHRTKEKWCQDIPFDCKRKKCDCYLTYSNLQGVKALNLLGDQIQHRLIRRLNPKAIFFDIDGTLTNSEGKITTCIKETLELLSKFYELYFITALPSEWAYRKCKSIKHLFSGGIFSDGAEVKDFKKASNQTLYIDREALEKLRSAIKELEIPRVYEYQDKHNHIHKIYHKSNRKDDKWIYKLTLPMTSHTDSLLLKEDWSKYKLNVIKERHSISFVHQNASKLRTLLGWMQDKGLEPDQVLVVGDSLKDCEVLAYFPHSVAVKRAVKEVQVVAKYVLEIHHLSLILKLNK